MKTPTIQPGESMPLDGGHTLYRLGSDEYQVRDSADRIVAGIWYSPLNEPIEAN